MSSTVLVHTLGQKTDTLAKLVIQNRGYTYIHLLFKNPSSNEATYRIAYGNTKNSTRWKVGPELTVAGSKIGYARQYGLRQGYLYTFFLERKENGQWVEQASTSSTKKYVSISTSKMVVSSSTSSNAALLTWIKYSNADHQVDIYDKKPENGVKQTPIKTLSQGAVKTSGSTGTVTVTGLGTNKVYHGRIMLKEPTARGTDFVELGSFEFETSDRANLTIDPTKTFASRVTMSWDKGGVGRSESDKKADFIIYCYVLDDKGKWKYQRDFGMGWTTEGKKTFTPEGLAPGKKYLFKLYRRGVDGRAVHQSSLTVRTNTTDMTLGNPESTRVLVKWEPVYDKAAYYVRYAPADGKGPLRTQSASPRTYYKITDLTPNTSYTVELLIKENSKYHTLQTDKFVTDKASILTQTSVKNNAVNLQVEAFHGDPCYYYVMDTTKKIKTKPFKIEKIGKTSVILNNLEIGKTYKLNLFRAEGGNWVIQKWDNNTTDHITVRSNDFLVSTSVASASALVAWDQTQSSSEYTVQIFDKVPSSKVDAKFTFSGDKVKTVDGEHTVVVSGLVKQTKYYGIISGNEKNQAGVETLVKMKEFDFVTSSSALFRVGKYFASYANFSWTPGDVQEADGVSEFRIKYYNYGARKWTTMAWQPHTNNTAVISGLSPGVRYLFDLERLGVDGSATREARSVIIMRTTKLEVDSVASRQIEAKWAPIYSNAQYQLTYTPSGGEPVLFGGGPFTKTSASISGLADGTDYKLNLYVIENSKPVGIATAALGTASSVATGSSTSMYGLIAAILAIIAVLAGMKMRGKR